MHVHQPGTGNAPPPPQTTHTHTHTCKLTRAMHLQLVHIPGEQAPTSQSRAHDRLHTLKGGGSSH